MLEKLARWLIFSVVLALVPLGVTWVIQSTHGQTPTPENLLGHGELLLIAAGLSAAATGELLGTNSDMVMAKIISGGVSIVILVFASIYFADVAAAHIVNQKLDLAIVKNTSLTVFACSMIAGACCVALSEV